MSRFSLPPNAVRFVALLFAAACGNAGPSVSPAPQEAGTPTSATVESSGRISGSDSSAQSVATATAAGRVRPGDILKLRIWREPDLSGEYSVREDGKLMVPKIGAIQAADFTPDSLRLHLETQFQKYLRNPAIEVTLLRRVAVLGEVRRPGSYPVNPTITVADLLSEAGGFTPAADQKKLQLTRRGQILRKDVPRYATLAELAVNSGDELYAIPKPVWMRASRTIISTAITTLGLAYAFLRLRGAID
jgi:polysaccharide biosynthesis/export protein